MGDLVVDDGEGAGGVEVGVEHSGDGAGVEEAGVAEGAVGEYCAVGEGDGFDGVVAGDEPVVAEGGGVVEEGLELGEGFAEGGGGLGERGTGCPVFVLGFIDFAETLLRLI